VAVGLAAIEGGVPGQQEVKLPVMIGAVGRCSLRQLWNCKVGILSVLTGFALMTLFPEARDLFNDRIGLSGLIEYATLVLLVWSLQVWFSAKSAIARATRFAEFSAGDVISLLTTELPQAIAMQRLWARRVDRIFPIALGLLSFGAIWTGILMARQDILVCEHVASQTHLKSCLGWATTQDLLEFDASQAAAKTAGAATNYSLPEVASSLAHLGSLAGFIAIAAAAFLAIVLLRERLLPSSCRELLSGANTLVMALLFGSAFYWPFELSDWAGRASLIPVLLGSWIPLVDWLSALSRRAQGRLGLRWPIVATAIIGLIVASTYVDRFHDVRTYRTAHWTAAQLSDGSPEAPPRQSYLDEALKRWMTVNGCANSPADCRMVLVAAEGGASRAAFFTSTVLGALLDATRRDPEKYVDFAQAAFMLSGVSGGALGVTTFRTALMESTRGAPPCRELDSIWFGAGEDGRAVANRDPTKNWRSCLQLLTAGDYLSPAIVGLSFRDQFALLAPSDRAVLLEQGIERHFNKVVHGNKTECGGPDDERGLCRAFGYVQPGTNGWKPLLLLNATSMDNGRPVLVSDLQLPVVSPDRRNCGNLFVVSQNVFELYASNPYKPTEILADSIPSCVYAHLEEAADMRLSTATVLSARFPIISPAGGIRYTDNFRDFVAEHVVDGGYFDNSGLESINRIIPFLQGKGLRPIVLYLTNDPWFFKATERAGRPLADPSLSTILGTNLISPHQGFWSRLFSFLSEPVATMYDLRSGHKEAALERTNDLIGGSAFIAIRVRRGVDVTKHSDPFCIDRPTPQGGSRISLYSPVMSWWLSPITQRVLDAQLCDQETINLLSLLLESLERKNR
jgi:hypothetical protein